MPRVTVDIPQDLLRQLDAERGKSRDERLVFVLRRYYAQRRTEAMRRVTQPRKKS